MDKIIFVTGYREYCGGIRNYYWMLWKKMWFFFQMLVLWSYKNKLMDEEDEERDRTKVEAHIEAQLQDQLQIQSIS